MNDIILKRGHGFQLDHIGLGVEDTERGVAWVQEQTGADVALHDPEPGQWYWSGSLAIGEESFLEIIGPNPDWKGFHPFRTLLQTLSEPKLLFWYIAVTDFEAFRSLAKANRAGLERVEAINIDRASPDQASYRRGYVGPGFMTERPNVIEWLYRPDRMAAHEPVCKLTDFRLANPASDTLNAVFDALGIEVRVDNGASSIGLTLETPNGPWSIDNSGIKWAGAGAFWAIAGLWLSHSFGGASKRNASNTNAEV